MQTPKKVYFSPTLINFICNSLINLQKQKIPAGNSEMYQRNNLENQTKSCKKLTMTQHIILR